MTVRSFIIQLLREDLDAELEIQTIKQAGQNQDDVVYPVVDGIALNTPGHNLAVVIVPSQTLTTERAF